jgi:hypothetical protein
MKAAVIGCRGTFGQPSPLAGEGGARSAPGEGSVLIVCKMLEDILKHRRRSLQHVIVPTAQSVKSFADQPRVSRLIALRGIMLAAVHFDHNLSVEADKIQDKSFERHLATKFESDKPAMPQKPPHRCFRFGGGMAHLPRVAAATLWN